MTRPIMTIPEAAARIGVNRFTLAHAARRGTLRASVAGGVWLVTEEALEEYERRSKGKPGRKPKGTVTAPAERPKRRPAADVSSPPEAPGGPETARSGESPPPMPRAAQKVAEGPPRRTVRGLSNREVHRHQGGPKTLYKGPGGGIYAWTQNRRPRRTSEGEIERWKAKGYAVAWVDEPTAEMLGAARGLNRQDRLRRAGSTDERAGSTKYSAVAERLADQEGDLALFSFEEIEALIGAPLPPGARLNPGYWTKAADGHAHLWRAIGWKAHLDRTGGGVRFRRGTP